MTEGLSHSIKKAGADFYPFLNHRPRSVDDCGKSRLVLVVNVDGLLYDAQRYSPRKMCPSLFRFVVKYRSVEGDAGISRGSHFVTDSP